MGKIILAQHGFLLADELAPEQFGVCRPGGMEVIIQDVKHWLKKVGEQTNLAILQLDFANAFNSLSRQHILAELHDAPDALRHYANYFCNGPLELHGPGFRITSSSGVQQGDPCGPLLFSLGIQSLLKKITSLGVDVRFYLDDGLLCGHPEQLTRALEEIQSFSTVSKLDFNLTKCQLWDLHGNCHGPPASMFQAVHTVPS